MTDQERQGRKNILATSRDRGALEAAAVELASSGDRAAIADLGQFLRAGDALARLDNLASPPEKALHLSRVFAALQQHPSPATAELCLVVLRSPDFLADDDRKIFLLPALAAVRPMSESVLDVFRQTNAEGYYNLNALLLVKNGSPNALVLFEEMIRDAGIEPSQRVDALHSAVLPYRTQLAVFQAMNHLLDADLPDEVRVGVIETIFDNRSADWFGVRKFPPTPPPWETASDEALRLVLAMADKVRTRPLPEPLAEAVNNTITRIREILTARRG
jgi:hypothetical protein